MTIHVHQLAGCAPTPLAHYLKGLGIHRLIAEQGDSEARAWWKDESFWIATRLSADQLSSFFLERYRPTPILSPWNGGSGFFYEDDKALSPLERSVSIRFSDFREGIAAARSLTAPLALAIREHKAAEAEYKLKKSEANKAKVGQAKQRRDEAKASLLPSCRRLWEDGLLEWFDAALAVGADGEPDWPALLGSGGNDGRLDFTNNSMQHLAALFKLDSVDGAPTPLARQLLPSALFAQPSPGLRELAAGQFLPGNAGGANMGAGYDGQSLVNPWDFVFTLEGSIVLASSVARRVDSADLPQAAAPFAFRAGAAGYPSATVGDDLPRGEQWMPLWSQPSRFEEVRSLFEEGRIRMGRDAATRAIEVPRALARLGAARGIQSFQRYGYIERNGQANLAVPLGRWVVTQQPTTLLDEVAEWSGRLQSVARDSQAPESIAKAARLVEEGMLDVCRPGVDTLRWQDLIISLGKAEAAILSSPRTAGDPKKGLSPLPWLGGGWLSALDDGSPEFRLAAALASQLALFRSKKGTAVASVRGHWMPIHHSDGPRERGRFATGASGLLRDPDVICLGRDLEKDCLALIARRSLMMSWLNPGAKQEGYIPTSLGLLWNSEWGASVADVQAFLDRIVDDRRVLALARPLMAVKWWDARPANNRSAEEQPAADYALVRVTHVGRLQPKGKQPVSIPPETQALTRLRAGDLDGGIQICLRRLRASGLRPTVRLVAGDAARARRLVASLAIPLRQFDLDRCIDLTIKPDFQTHKETQ